MLGNIKLTTVQHTKFLQQRHFGSLDGVRCFCILAVLWHHSNPPIAPQLSTRGFLGVDMFFVLSGFLIVTLLLRERTNKGTISLRKFYARRALRIFPLYYGILLLLTLAYGVFKSKNDHSSIFFSALPFYLTYISNWSLIQASGLGITWSLATEEQFYLFWPAIEKFMNRRAVYGVLGLAVFVNQLINFGVLDRVFAQFYGLTEAPRLEILDATFTPICLGIVLAHLLHRLSTFSLAFHSFGHRYAPIATLIILLGVISFSPTDISGFPRLLIQSLMTLWLGALVIRENHTLQPLMTLAPVVQVGKISYGMYLYHIWAFVIVDHAIRAVDERYGLEFPLALFVIGTILTLLVSELSYRLYEAPFLKLKKHFS